MDAHQVVTKDSIAPTKRKALMTKARTSKALSHGEQAIIRFMQTAGMTTAMSTPIVPPMNPKYIVTF